MQTVLRRVAVAALGAVASLTLIAPAAAHVTVNPSEVVGGSYARLDFRVPNESEKASTISIEVSFPEDAPFASVRTIRVPGWTAETTTRKLDTPIDVHGREVTEAVDTITWTAEDEEDGIAPGEFGEFGVSVGPVPHKGELVFKVIQTYSDDTESAWIDEPTTDGSEPDEPAPVLTIVHGDDDDDHGDDDTDEASDDHADENDASDTATILGAIGVGLGAVALVVAALALRRRSV
ncbi:YcnI family protein [Stackebrandtia soli]|uniref:YcnI family copper-binding membrane protein n=1 Tax=Stackebrandtia soli TaxID=1892856 RepID=UPI0039E9B14F